MKKPGRALAICSVMLLAASLTISAAVPNPAAAPVNAKVKFQVAPGKIVCKGDSVPVIIWYSWNNNSDLAPLAPLVPLTPKGQQPQPAPLPGTLKLTASHGHISLTSKPVDYGPGTVELVYTGTKVEKVDLIATLAYPGQSGTAKRSFEVKECNYHLKIFAHVWVEKGDNFVLSYMAGEGDLSVSDQTIYGELELLAGFKLYSNNPVLLCLSKPSSGHGRVKIDGKKITGKSGDTYLYFNLDYETMTGFKQGSMDCTDKETGERTGFTIDAPDPVEPGMYLENELSFNNGNTSLYGTYGEDGKAYYTLTPIT
ncbi:MAG: hypothetical protein WBM17_07155 [Anaerolineales bacterium]